MLSFAITQSLATVLYALLDPRDLFDFREKPLEGSLGGNVNVSVWITQEFKKTTQECRKVMDKLQIRDGIE